jgi:hypothetical protein
VVIGDEDLPLVAGQPTAALAQRAARVKVLPGVEDSDVGGVSGADVVAC